MRIDLSTPEELPIYLVYISRFGATEAEPQFFVGDFIYSREDLEHELDAGNALVDVVVHGDQAKRQVRDLFLRHRAHFITHFGRWTIATLA